MKAPSVNATPLHPYFRVTEFILNPDSLKGWFDWFDGLGIPCAIIRHKQKVQKDKKLRDGYALWRVGVEAVAVCDKGYNTSRPCIEPLVGELMKACHGFELALEEKAACA